MQLQLTSRLTTSRPDPSSLQSPTSTTSSTISSTLTMGWKLLQKASSQEAALHSLQLGQTVHLILDDGPKERFAVVATDELGDDQEPLARIGMIFLVNSLAQTN
jgi:hypothetical protein